MKTIYWYGLVSYLLFQNFHQNQAALNPVTPEEEEISNLRTATANAYDALKECHQRSLALENEKNKLKEQEATNNSSNTLLTLQQNLEFAVKQKAHAKNKYEELQKQLLSKIKEHK